MRPFFTAVLLGGACLHASILPTYHLNQPALQAFGTYTSTFEKSALDRFSATGELWIDNASSSKRSAFDAGKPVVEPRENADISGGSIHHFSGAMHIAGGTIDAVRRIMQDYSNYPKYFKPDVSKGSGSVQPDSTPADEHYQSQLRLTQSTIWLDVAYDAAYDSHYRRLDAQRWVSKSTTVSVHELRDPKNPDGGTYPDGDDHGFLWRTNTYWLVRERNGGVDVELDSMTLSRPIPVGFSWWGTKRTKDAVEKMLKNMKEAVESSGARASALSGMGPAVHEQP